MRSLFLTAAAALSVALSGCASHHLAAAEQDQQAADSLHRIGAHEAGRAAQDRADNNRRMARCDGGLDCALDVIGQLLFSITVDKGAQR